MSSVNKQILIGNLGDNIKMHYFDGGGCVGSAPLATTYSYKNSSGEQIDETEWHKLVFRNKAAENIEKYTKKGSRLYIEGRTKTREWEDQNGNKRYSKEVIVNEFRFLSVKEEGQSSPGTHTPVPEPPLGEEDDDLPF